MTTEATTHNVLPGGHFFLNSQRAALLDMVVSALNGH